MRDVRPTVALLTDFGVRDSYVGTLKGVIATIAADANVIDLSNSVPPHDVQEGAFHLLIAHPYFPADTVFCCVVDPGVGSDRRAVAVRFAPDADGQGPFTFVGPDNGLATGMLLKRQVETCVVLDEPAYHLPFVSSTFHGRDVFAPVAAHLAGGVAMTSLGQAFDPSTLVRLPWQPARQVSSGFEASIIHHDQFGNLITNLEADALRPGLERWSVRLDSTPIGRIHRSFSSVGSGHPLAYVGSSGLLELAVRDGSARQVLSVTPSSLVHVVSGKS